MRHADNENRETDGQVVTISTVAAEMLRQIVEDAADRGLVADGMLDAVAELREVLAGAGKALD